MRIEIDAFLIYRSGLDIELICFFWIVKKIPSSVYLSLQEVNLFTVPYGKFEVAFFLIFIDWQSPGATTKHLSLKEVTCYFCMVSLSRSSLSGIYWIGSHRVL